METRAISEADIEKILGFIDIALKSQGLTVMGEAYALLQRINAVQPVKSKPQKSKAEG